MENFAVPSTGRKPAAKSHQHSAQVWESHQERITQLYAIDGKPLNEVMAKMQEEYGFVAS